MARQADLFGGWQNLNPPPVPPVVFNIAPAKRRLRKADRPPCMHCQMIAHRIFARLPVPGWTAEMLASFIILGAIFAITQVDGSTLNLCEQHTDQHEQRGAQK